MNIPILRWSRDPEAAGSGRRFERAGTWYSLIRDSLVEEAAGTVLTPCQAQSLMVSLRAEHVFSTPPPDHPSAAGSPRAYGSPGPERG